MHILAAHFTSLSKLLDSYQPNGFYWIFGWVRITLAFTYKPIYYINSRKSLNFISCFYSDWIELTQTGHCTLTASKSLFSKYSQLVLHCCSQLSPIKIFSTMTRERINLVMLNIFYLEYNSITHCWMDGGRLTQLLGPSILRPNLVWNILNNVNKLF